jgi:hypothetical protein
MKQIAGQRDGDAKGRAWMSDKDNEMQNHDENSIVEQELSAESERMDYDNLWKIVLTRFFWDALKIFLPELYKAADRNQEPEFLDKELQKVTFDLSGGANRTDLLARFLLKDGNRELALCHTEVQQDRGEGDLPTRMYKYKEAIHLIHDREPIGIAVTMAPRPKGEKSFYYSGQFGVESLYKYIHVPVLEQEDEVLLSEENHAGLILYAAKCAWKSGKDEARKFAYLRKISELWAERRWNPEDKRVTLLAVEYLMHLNSEEYIEQFTAHMELLVKNLEEGEKEMYVSAFEKVYTKKGREEGRKEGMEEGMEEGRKEGRKEGREKGMEEGREEGYKNVARNMLVRGYPMEQVVECTTLPREEVEKLLN